MSENGTRGEAEGIEPAFIDYKAIAKMLGMSKTSFFKRRPLLMRAGFPGKDPLIGKYLRADVEAWIQTRRRVGTEPKTNSLAGINFAAI